MKNIVALAAISTALSLSAADSVGPYEKIPQLDSSLKRQEEVLQNASRRFIPYVRLGPDIMNVQVGTSFQEIQSKNSVSPAIGLGFRSESSQDAVDLSFTMAVNITEKTTVESSSDGSSTLDLSERFYTLQFFYPKLLYLRYTTPATSSSPYFGGGLGWSQFFSQETENSFNGLSGVFAFGYEMGRSSIIRQMAQIEITQPLIAAFSKGAIFTPSLELSYCLGF